MPTHDPEPDFATLMGDLPATPPASPKRARKPRIDKDAMPWESQEPGKSPYIDIDNYVKSSGSLSVTSNENKGLSTKDKLTPQEALFLSIYLETPITGANQKVSINEAMIRAGYVDMGEGNRYRIAKRIIKKYESSAPGTPEIFRAIGFGEVEIARGIAKKALEAQSEAVSLRAHELAARCTKMTEPEAQSGSRVNIIINTGAPCSPGTEQGTGPGIVIDGQAVDDDIAPRPVRPLQISR
jgi:hypothetical protein